MIFHLARVATDLDVVRALVQVPASPRFAAMSAAREPVREPASTMGGGAAYPTLRAKAAQTRHVAEFGRILAGRRAGI